MTYCTNPDHKPGEWRDGLVRWKCCYNCKIKWIVKE